MRGNMWMNRDLWPGRSRSGSVQILKAHGSQNDVLLVDGSPSAHGLTDRASVSDFVRAICDRTNLLGGADGVYFVDRRATPAVASYVNSDGTPAEYCGNGMRCVGRYLLDAEGRRETLVSSGGMLFEVTELPRSVGGVYNIAVRSRQPVNFRQISLQIDTVAADLRFAWLSVPNPHLVAICEQYNQYNEELLTRTAAEVKASSAFSAGINVSLAMRASESEPDFFVHTYERGAGLTQACASGAVASAMTLITERFARAGEDIFIRNVGGPITVRAEETPGGLTPTQSGNATYISSCAVRRDRATGRWSEFEEPDYFVSELQSANSLWWENANHLKSLGILTEDAVAERATVLTS